MRPKPTNTGSAKAIRASVSREMAKPRMSRSARIAALDQDRKRVRLPPSVSLPGTVEKIVPARLRNKHEKALIGVVGADRRYRRLRTENTLSDDHGDKVRLKRGAHVEPSVTAEAESAARMLDEDS